MELSDGTKGSVRPDFYKEGKASIDIKNYNVETPAGRTRLVNNIEKQFNQRIRNLPEGTQQIVQIDIRGQNIEYKALKEIEQELLKRTNGGIKVIFKIK